MNKKNVKGIGFGIGMEVEGIDNLLDGLLDMMSSKVGKKNDKGIYQNFTAITSWDTNGGFIQIQEFEDGKATGKPQECSFSDFIGYLVSHDIDKLPSFPIITDKYFPNNLLSQFLEQTEADDNGIKKGHDEICGFISGLKFIPDSRKFSRPDWSAKDLGQAYLMKTEEEVKKEEEVLFITSYLVSDDVFLQKTKNIKAKVIRLDYEGPDMTRFINAFDALNGVTVVVDMNSISAFQGATKFLTDILCEMKTSYNEDEVALYVLNHIGFELIMGQDRNKIVPEGSVISK